jgi:hypothetical protein
MIKALINNGFRIRSLRNKMAFIHHAFLIKKENLTIYRGNSFSNLISNAANNQIRFLRSKATEQTP